MHGCVAEIDGLMLRRGLHKVTSYKHFWHYIRSFLLSLAMCPGMITEEPLTGPCPYCDNGMRVPTFDISSFTSSAISKPKPKKSSRSLSVADSSASTSKQGRLSEGHSSVSESLAAVDVVAMKTSSGESPVKAAVVSSAGLSPTSTRIVSIMSATSATSNPNCLILSAGSSSSSSQSAMKKKKQQQQHVNGGGGGVLLSGPVGTYPVYTLTAQPSAAYQVPTVPGNPNAVSQLAPGATYFVNTLLSSATAGLSPVSGAALLSPVPVATQRSPVLIAAQRSPAKNNTSPYGTIVIKCEGSEQSDSNSKGVVKQQGSSPKVTALTTGGDGRQVDVVDSSAHVTQVTGRLSSSSSSSLDLPHAATASNRLSVSSAQEVEG
jgi:hypothetical protein